jgi:hypothetical protein
MRNRSQINFNDPRSWLQRTRLICVTLVFFLQSPSAFAWGQDAHRVICEIAWLELNRDDREQLAALLEDGGHSRFNDSCVWADKVRQVPRYRYSTPLHYMNVGRLDTTLGEAAQCKDCVLEAIREFSLLLEGADSHRYSASRAESLLFLSHLIGDLHQPLHVGYADDRGGNSVTVVIGRRETSLHGLWDTHVPRRVIGKHWQQTARRWQGQIVNQDRQAWRATNEADWAQESLQITRRVYATLPDIKQPLGNDYLRQFDDTARLQILKAGVRLAARLQQLFHSHRQRSA